jgi:hypothetical protein
MKPEYQGEPAATENFEVLRVSLVAAPTFLPDCSIPKRLTATCP